MPPKQQKKQASNFKQGAQVKDILPSSVKNVPRDGKSLKQIEVQPGQQKQEVYFEQFPEIEEWPGDEAAKTFDFGVQGKPQFVDSTVAQFKLPKSYGQSENQSLIWRRPAEILKLEEQETQEIEYKLQHRRRISITNNSYKPQQDQQAKTAKDDILIQQSRGGFMNLFSSVTQDIQQSDENKPQSESTQQQQVTQAPSINIQIFTVFQRDETTEEFEQRKKDQEQLKLQEKKGAKKAAKKEEVIEETIQKVNDVKLNNINMSYKIPADSKWIASQLQLIKDKKLNDINTNKPIWTKIYPQKDGVPVYNPSGKYWVKLYYMGKERKIEIDDKMPVDYTGVCLFPRSVEKNEIWSCIFTKALLKLLLLTQKVDHIQSLTGNGFVIYSLTGMLAQTIAIDRDLNQNQEKFSLIREFLNDQHYTENDILVSCYCSSSFKPIAPSNQSRAAKDFYIDQIKKKDQEEPQEETKYSKQQQPQLQIPPTIQETKQEEEESPTKKKKNPLFNEEKGLSPERIENPFKVKQILLKDRERAISLSGKPCYIIPGFAYALIDSFYNEQFNMVYSQKRSEQEVKLRQEYYEKYKTASTQKMSKDQKLEYRKKKKELRDRIGEEDKKKIDLITKPPIQYRLFKVKTNAGKVPILNIYCPFPNDEIEIAKTCIINELSKPPNYDVPEIRDDGKSVISAQNKEESFIIKPLDDFSTVPHCKKPLQRGLGGHWMKDLDILGCFQYMQIFYNPKKIPNYKLQQINYDPNYELTHNVESEIVVIKKNQEQNEELSKKLLIGFQYKNSKSQEIKPKPYCKIQKFDFGQFLPIYDYQPLQENNLSQLIKLKNQNTIFKLLVYSPLTYNLQISCDNQYDMISLFDYLKTYEQYSMKNFTIEYQPMEVSKYQQLFKFKLINSKEQLNQMFIKVKSTTDCNMLKYFRLKLTEQVQEGTGIMMNGMEGVYKNLKEFQFSLQNYQLIQLPKSGTYYLLMEGEAPYSIAEGSLEIEYYMKGEDIQISQIEQVEPLEYNDKYIPTKYGILFMERLYVNELTQSTLHVRLVESDNAQQQQQQQQDKGGKGKKQGQEAQELVEKEMRGSRLIKLELFENGKLIQYNFGYNTVMFSNIDLKSTKDDTVQYLLKASFDLREWPECKTVNENTQSICWILKVISSDTIFVVRDTQKEDREKALIKSWEDAELGRSEKSKKTRKKYQLYLKKQNKEELTEEELQLLNEPRISKKQQQEEVQQKNQKGSKQQAPKKDDKKGAKKGQEVVVEQKKEERKLPKSESHQMGQVVQFLQHMEDQRVKEQLALHAGLINVRSDENKKEITENAKMTDEDLTGTITRSMQLREEYKLYQRDQKQILMNDLDSSKQSFKKDWEEFLKNRDQVKGKMSQKTAKQNEIMNVIKQQQSNITIENLEALINEIKQIEDFSKDIIEVANKKLINMKIVQLQENINSAITMFDIENLQKYITEFEEKSTTGIDVTIIEKAQSMLEEAKENPNYVQEKQAEAKKAAKKGKK